MFAIVARPTGAVTTGMRNAQEIVTMVLSLNRLTEGDARFEVPGLRVATILSAIEAGGNFEKKSSMQNRGSKSRPTGKSKTVDR